nr:MAG TPA: hypothetical protein [Caudoviricetes sp.]
MRVLPSGRRIRSINSNGPSGRHCGSVTYVYGFDISDVFLPDVIFVQLLDLLDCFIGIPAITEENFGTGTASIPCVYAKLDDLCFVAVVLWRQQFGRNAERLLRAVCPHVVTFDLQAAAADVIDDIAFFVADVQLSFKAAVKFFFHFSVLLECIGEQRLDIGAEADILCGRDTAGLLDERAGKRKIDSCAAVILGYGAEKLLVFVGGNVAFSPLPRVLVGQRNNAIVQRTAEYVAEQEEFAVTLLVQGQGIEIVFFDAADIDRIGAALGGGCVVNAVVDDLFHGVTPFGWRG